jgi:hypothetical protein
MELSWHQQRAAGMHALPYDIVGYTYQAGIYCPAHILGHVLNNGTYNLEAISAVETMLDDIAAERKIDRGNESSYDSGDFPKVIFRDSVHNSCTPENDYLPGQCADTCATCGEQLTECPNEPVPDDYLSEFTQAYSHAMLWANTVEYRPDCDEKPYGPVDSALRCEGHDVDPNAWVNGNDALWALHAFTEPSQASIREDCTDFVRAQWHLLSNLDYGSRSSGYSSAELAGHDFALTRNGHGAGFWDRGLGEAGDKLTEACRPYGASNAYYSADDDGSCVHLDDERI